MPRAPRFPRVEELQIVVGRSREYQRCKEIISAYLHLLTEGRIQQMIRGMVHLQGVENLKEELLRCFQRCTSFRSGTREFNERKFRQCLMRLHDWYDHKVRQELHYMRHRTGVQVLAQHIDERINDDTFT